MSSIQLDESGVIPYEEMGNREGIRGRGALTVPDKETGDDLPERSGDPPSDLILEAASSSPTAFALEDPIAGAAFWLSVLPICSLCAGFKAKELVVETTDSVGLPGLSKAPGTSPAAAIPDLNDEFVGMGLRELGEGVKELAEPLIVANLRRRSSNGAPPGGP